MTTQCVWGGSDAGPRERAPWSRERLRLQGLGTGRTTCCRSRTFPQRVARPCCAGGRGASSVQTRDTEGTDGGSPRDTCRLPVPRDLHAPSNPALVFVSLQRPTSPTT